MSTINRVSSKASTQLKDIPVVTNSANIGKHNRDFNRKDAFLVSPGWPKQTDWNMAIKEELDTLIQSFPGVNIVIAEECTKEQLAQIAAQMGEGTHLVISRKWLDQMKTGAEAYEQGKGILKRLLTQLSNHEEKMFSLGAFLNEDGVTFWKGKPVKEDKDLQTNPFGDGKHSFFEQLKDSQNKSRDANSRFRIKKPSTYSVSDLYTRLAGAGSKSQLRAAISDVHRSIGEFRMASVYGTDKERAKAKAAMKSLQKLLLRGGRKMQRFNQEEIVRLREKRARKQDEQRKALQMRIELQKKRSNRRTADRAIALEGHLDDINNPHLSKRHNEDERKYGRYSEYIEYVPPALPLPVITAGGLSTPAAPSMNIEISPTLPFSDI